MSEIALQPAAQNPANVEMASLERYNSLAAIGRIEASGVMVEDREGIAQSLDTLRGEFGIDDEAFKNPISEIMMIAVADRHNTLEQTPDLSTGAKTAELEYIADLVIDAVGEHTDYRELQESHLKETISDDAKKDAYDKFTQPEVSADLDHFIRGEAFEDLRKRLGIIEEEPFEVRVLSIDDKDGSLTYGLDPGVNWDEVDKDYAAVKEAGDEQQVRYDYKKGLSVNGKKFKEATGSEGPMSPAWVTFFDDGTKYLCMPLPTAEKLLYKDEPRANYYDDDARDRDLATLMHEYAHTQKSLLTGVSVGSGIALEELRAEHFSGDKQGYIDIKKFFWGMRMLTGYSPKQGFEAHRGGFDQEGFVVDIAKNVGLKGFLDSMTAIPTAYAENKDSNPYIRAIAKHNGGNLSGAFGNVYKRLLERDGPEELDRKISEFVDEIKEKIGASTISVEGWFAYGNLDSFRDIGIENFRRRYPEESDGYDYIRHKKLDEG